MAPSKAPTLRLRHILEEAGAIRASTTRVSFEAFRDTWLLKRAVEHGLLIISEAARAIPSDLKARHSGIPWRHIESLGNFLRHEYGDIDAHVLWRIVHDDLPLLETVVVRMLAEVAPPGDGP